MTFIDYAVHNYCKRCNHRFLKKIGSICPMCNGNARTAPRKTARNREIYRNYSVS